MLLIRTILTVGVLRSTRQPGMIANPQGDPVHPTALGNDGRPEPITEFDYDAVDGTQPGETIAFSEMVAAFCLILGWMSRCKRRKDLMSVGAHASALLFFLDPTRSEFTSLADIADSAGMSRASLSKALLNLRDESGLRSWQCGKLHSSREVYSRVQITIHASGARKCRCSAQSFDPSSGRGSDA